MAVYNASVSLFYAIIEGFMRSAAQKDYIRYCSRLEDSASHFHVTGPDTTKAVVADTIPPKNMPIASLTTKNTGQGTQSCALLT